MSGAPRLRSINVADSEVRPVLGPAGNKTRSVVARKPASKPLRSKVEKTPEVVPAVEEKKAPSSPFSASSPPLRSILVPSTLRKQDQLLQSNLSLDASCSSDASSDSLQSRSSAGRVSRSSSTTRRRKPCVSKPEKAVTECVLPSPDSLQEKKRCAWVTPNTEPCYVAFHDEEWGIPVHDDRKLFELLVLSGALAEITWPTILIKRHIFREVFADFDPVVVSKLNEKKLTAAGSTASSLLSELKLRSIIENARQISKIVDEFGSFDKYIWSFVNHKPIVSKFRYPRQIPTRTAKAEVISKDLLRRGFRSVSPTIIYSFMQVAGMTNDHLVSCFRFQECVDMAEGIQEDRSKTIAEEKKADNMMDLALARAIDELSISSESSSIHGKKEDGF